MQILARFPIVEADNTLVTVVVGQPEAAFGDEVSVEAVFDRKKFESLYVASVDAVNADEVVSEVLELFSLRSTDAFLDLLSKRYGTRLPHNVPITIYTFIDQPVELTATDDVIPEVE